MILEEEMKTVAHKVFISTDDGSYGYKGFNTEILKQQLNAGKVDIVFACGPIPMMQRIAQITKQSGVQCIVSLNAIMLDGTGMCGSCRVKIGRETKLCCVDGPDFDAHLVDFEELANRQKRFLAQEKISLQEFKKRMGL